jgi:K+-sensing histidine kinase KdpD
MESGASSHDEIAGLLAHDLKTPLSAIAMNLDFVLAELEAQTPPELRSALDDCRHANARAIRIVSDMADVARLAVGDYRPSAREVNPADLLEGAVERAAAEAAARGVSVAWSADCGVVVLDPDLTGRAIDRLLERAVRHARPGSALTIEYTLGTISIVAQSSTGARTEPVARALAIHFADAAIRAQGGSLRVEIDGNGLLVFRIIL